MAKLNQNNHMGRVSIKESEGSPGRTVSAGTLVVSVGTLPNSLNDGNPGSLTSMMGTLADYQSQ